MKFELCTNCGKATGHKRALGWGTFFAAVFTGGLSLLTIPFYPLRCIVCGSRPGVTEGPAVDFGRTMKLLLIVGGTVVGLILIRILLGP